MSLINKEYLLALGFKEIDSKYEFNISEELNMVVTMVSNGFSFSHDGDDNRFLPDKHDKKIGVFIKDVLEYMMVLSKAVGAECIRMEMVDYLK